MNIGVEGFHSETQRRRKIAWSPQPFHVLTAYVATKQQNYPA